jgi:hypothetical protein
MESDDLCLCLDDDRQSMFASCFAKKYLRSNGTNIVTSFQNMGSCLIDLFTCLQDSVGLPCWSYSNIHPLPNGKSHAKLLQVLAIN